MKEIKNIEELKIGRNYIVAFLNQYEPIELRYHGVLSRLDRYVGERKCRVFGPYDLPTLDEIIEQCD